MPESLDFTDLQPSDLENEETIEEESHCTCLTRELINNYCSRCLEDRQGRMVLSLLSPAMILSFLFITLL